MVLWDEGFLYWGINEKKVVFLFCFVFLNAGAWTQSLAHEAGDVPTKGELYSSLHFYGFCFALLKRNALSRLMKTLKEEVKKIIICDKGRNQASTMIPNVFKK